MTIGIATSGVSVDPHDYRPELKRAGAGAYNRWLAGFCSAAPRLLGVALVGSLAEPELAAGEIRRAHDEGLRGGVLLPLHYTGLPFYDHERYEPVWSVCEELDLPVHSHAGTGLPEYGTGSPIVGALE